MTKKLNNIDGVTDLILWHKPMLSIGGLWPTESRGFKFYTLLVYFIIHLSLVISDFIKIFGHLEAMIDNLGEMALLSMIMAKMIVLRYSKLLPGLIDEVEAGNKDNYRNDVEKRIYMQYVDVGLRFFKLTLWTTTLATTAYYFKALQSVIAAGKKCTTSDKFRKAGSIKLPIILEFLFTSSGFLGETLTFVMPYHTRLFFNITSIRTYLLLYVYQLPMIYIFSCYAIIACFMLSFIFHACGQLSVLTYRIKNARTVISATGNHMEPTFRDIILNHNKIIWTAKTVNDIFSFVLLDEIVICSVIQGLCMYNILLNSSLADAIVLLSFLLYVSTMLLVMYGYCLAGDFLMQESVNVHDSCYDCEWYDMTTRCKKFIIICMIRARIPLSLNGGGFYVFSLESFTGVVKSALAYVSMLRQIL